jgi:serine O-acetyltransferase
LAIAHKGTIIVNSGALIGENCRLHVGVNIGTIPGCGHVAPKIGDNVYIAPGVKIYGNIEIASGVVIGANAVVTKSFLQENICIAGVPAKKISDIGRFEIEKNNKEKYGYLDYVGHWSKN